MATIQELYTQALLAQAAYADLTPGKITSTLTLEGAGSMAKVQAEDFAKKWTVVDQYDDIDSGLNVTIFENMASGTRYLAIRGTNDFEDILTDATLAVGFNDDQYDKLQAKVDFWKQTKDSTGQYYLPNTFTVTGHSLGGYLATALARSS